MAEQVQISGSDGLAKVRSPLGVAVLSVITLGIYAIFWYFFINREMRDVGRAKNASDELGESPGTSVLAITLGALIIFPAIISLVHTFKRVTATQRLAGVEQINGWIALILAIVISPAFYAYLQSGLNKAWETGKLSALPAGGGGGAIGAGETPVSAEKTE